MEYKNQEATWPKFLIIEATQKAETPRVLADLSPFIIHKSILSIAGEPKSVKKLFSGDILVEVHKKAHCDNLLKTTSIYNIPITVRPHGTLNSCKGVIRCRDLIDCTEEEMLAELKGQGVIAVRRIFITRNGKKILTGTSILTFNSPEPPKSLKAAYLHLNVDRYIPNPLRCFKCQKFGHHQAACSQETVCGRCGQPNHGDSGCEETPRCINCSGGHPSYSRECPKFALEKEIVSYKFNNNTSFPEARRLVMASKPARPYAQVVAGCSKKNVSTQTEITWPSGAAGYKISQVKTVDTQTNTVNHTNDANNTKKDHNPPKINEKPKSTNKEQSNKHKDDDKLKKAETSIKRPTTSKKLTEQKTKVKKCFERIIKPLSKAQLKELEKFKLARPSLADARAASGSSSSKNDNMDTQPVSEPTIIQISRAPVLPPNT